MRLRFILFLLLCGAAGSGEPGSIRWIKNLKQASELAQEANRRFLGRLVRSLQRDG
jgi:hypothetical protein